MAQTLVPRESAEYFEILSEIFADFVHKSAPAHESNGSGDITPSLVQCLQYIYQHGPSSIRRIASGLSVSLPAASQLVDRLVQKELVTREHSLEDRRLAKVDLTKAGRQIVLGTRKARSEWLHDILDKMPEENKKALVKGLEEFVEVALESTGHFEEACAHCGIDHLAFCIVSKVRAATTGKPMEEF
jgi:DNA-binding MarR family transcriptional regulator